MATSDDHSSSGSEDLTETVESRPDMPEEPSPASLGQREVSDVELSSDVESLFRESDLFRGLTSQEVRELVRASRLTTYGAGDILFSQGDEPEALYLIESGEFEVRATSSLGEEVVLAILGNRTVVGEMALLEGSNRSATVEALSECSVFRLSRDSFNKLREKRRPAAYKLILNLAATLGERRRQTDKRVSEVFEDPRQHIDAFEAQVHDILGRIRKA